MDKITKRHNVHNNDDDDKRKYNFSPFQALFGPFSRGGDLIEVVDYQAVFGVVLCLKLGENFVSCQKVRFTPPTWGLKI